MSDPNNGTVHAMETKMRQEGQGVFASPENKAKKASLDEMLKDELIDMAEKKGLEVLSSDTKADIIAKIQGAE